jgi:lipoprotein-anchoring transpeptidase ErfK/SrfK
MRLTILLLVATTALCAAPSASAMPLQTVRIGALVPAVRAEGSGAPAKQAPRHRFTLVDESAGTVVRAAPGGRIMGELPGRTALGTTTWLWAVATSRDGHWAQVVLPWTPNGRTGWVTLRRRREIHTRAWVQVDLSRRRVMLMRGRRVLDSFPAAVGASVSPTPIGHYSVTDPISTGDPSGPYGWYAFGLSGHQPHLPPGWTGGDQIAIHGTNDPASLGTAASAGCLRVSAGALSVLKRALRPGTPVVIHP